MFSAENDNDTCKLAVSKERSILFVFTLFVFNSSNYCIEGDSFWYRTDPKTELKKKKKQGVPFNHKTSKHRDDDDDDDEKLKNTHTLSTNAFPFSHGNHFVYYVIICILLLSLYNI